MTTNGCETRAGTERRPTARFVRRQAAWLAAAGVVVALGMTAVLFSLQTRMIFPGAETQGTPGAQVKPAPGTDLVRLKTASGIRVTALFGPALSPTGKPLPDAGRRPTVLYFYGNGTCLRHTVDSDFRRFRRLGVNVLIPEYVGYGMSGGLPSEAGCYETADAAYDHLKVRPDVDPSRIIAVGRSLGGAVAIDLASRREVAGLIVLSTFTSMTDMTKKQLPVSLLPVSLLLRHKFDSLSKIGRVKCPILIGHGDKDGLVPHEMAGILARAAKAPVATFTVEGADHNDMEEVNAEQVAEAIRAFFAKFAVPVSR